MNKTNKEEWEIEAKLNYLIGKLTGRQTDIIIKDELKNILSSQKTKLLDELKEYAEGKKKELRIEEKNGEEKDLMIEIFGEAKTPEHIVERRYGYNQSLTDIITFINSIIN